MCAAFRSENLMSTRQNSWPWVIYVKTIRRSLTDAKAIREQGEWVELERAHRGGHKLLNARSQPRAKSISAHVRV